MRRRVAILGLYHETNTFIGQVLSVKDFNCFKGGEIRKSFAYAYHEIGGMYEVFDQEGIDVVDIFFADATPAGRIGTEAYNFFLDELLLGIKKNLPLDGCMLAAHGAAAGESLDDIDGNWFGCVREMMGESIPLIATLDPHANVSRQMVAATDAMFTYKTNPHVDQRETGKKAAQLMVDVLRGKVNPVQYLTELPLAISIEQQCTYLEPCKQLYALAHNLTVRCNAIITNIFLGFPYADVAEMGSSIVVVTNGNLDTATDIAGKIEKEIFGNMEAYTGEKTKAADAIEKAAFASKPVLLLDMGDNIGGGSSGNSTVLLRMLNADQRFRFFICLYDPQIVKEAEKHAAGTSFAITVNEFENGADNYSCEVKLVRTGDGKFKEQKAVHGGKSYFDMGNIAVVQTTGGGVILFTSLKMPPFSLKQLTQFDIQPDDFDIIVAKGVNAPLAAYREVCPSIIQVDTPGVTQADATRFQYKKRKKPMFPFESIEACYASTE